MNRPSYLTNWLKRAHNGDVMDRQAAYYVEYLEDVIQKTESKNKSIEGQGGIILQDDTDI